MSQLVSDVVKRRDEMGQGGSYPAKGKHTRKWGNKGQFLGYKSTLNSYRPSP